MPNFFTSLAGVLKYIELTSKKVGLQFICVLGHVQIFSRNNLNKIGGSGSAFKFFAEPCAAIFDVEKLRCGGAGL